MVSGYWSGMVCGVRYLVYCPIWCLIAGSTLVSTFWTGVWSGVVSGYWFWWCEVSGLVSAFDCDCDPNCDWDAHVYDLNLYFKFLCCSEC